MLLLLMNDKEKKLAPLAAAAVVLLLSSCLLVEANYEALPKSNLVGEKNSLPELVHHALTSKAPLLAEQPASSAHNNVSHLSIIDINANHAAAELLASTKAPASALEPLSAHNSAPSGHLVEHLASTKAPGHELAPVPSSVHASGASHANLAELLHSNLSSSLHAGPEAAGASAHNASHSLAALVHEAAASTKAPALLMPASISLATTARGALSTAAPASLTGVSGSLKPSVASIAGLLAKEEAKAETELKSLTTLAPSSTSTPLNSSSAAAAAAHEAEPLPKLCDYLKPMCETSALDKVSPKQLAKVQTHFKKFVELTSGKLGACFLDHYGFEPAQKPVSVAEVRAICASKSLAANLKGSYKSFKACAVKNWEPAVDKELDKILAARANCTKNHKHNETVLAHDDDDELSMINEVVSKVLGGDKSFMNSSNVKVIDFSANTLSTLAPSAKPAAASSAAPAAHNSRSALLVAAASTLAPSLAPSLAPAAHSSVKPTVGALHAALASSAAPALAAGAAHSTAAPALAHGSSTLSPELSAIKANVNGMMSDPNTVLVFLDDSTSKPVAKAGGHAPSTLKPAAGGVPSTLKTAAASTSAPSAALAHKLLSAAPALSSAKPSVAGAATSKAPANKQLATIEEVLKRQEKEKAELELKLKLEREKLMKQLQKKQDELDAHYAIKALQAQREHSSDAKLHQLEHQRQMAIDPVGHTIKHQQYELNKQQKLLAKS